MTRKFWLVSSISVLIIFLAIFVCQGVSAGGEMAEIEDTIALLEKENAQLQKEIAQETSCAKLYGQVFDQKEIMALKR